MKLLALDTAMGACSVAIHHSGRDVLAKAFVAMDRGHAEAIAPMVRDVMAQAHISFGELDRIVVTVGPGTFTGVRIGLAMARGLGLALDIPVVGIDTLTAISVNLTEDGLPALVASDARRDEIYAALFDGFGKIRQQPAVMSTEACLQLLPQGPLLVLGTAGDDVTATSSRSDLIRSPAGDVPNAANFGRLGFDLPATGQAPLPLYLRPPDAKSQNATGIQIRSAGLAEAEIFRRLHAECFESPWGAMEFAELMAMPGAAAALALEQNKPLGFILSRSAADEAEIITIAVRPEAQRRGVA
jgi:tRNA threonylcarbamoyladenosine biosynthesis protein TsaB